MDYRSVLSKYVGSQRGCSLVTALLLFLWVAGESVAAVTVAYPSDGPAQVRMAAKEVRRYVYLTTGKLLTISDVRTLPTKDDLILVVEDSAPILTELGGLEGIKATRGGFYLKSISDNDRQVLVIAGGGPVETLYGAYRFAEHMGVRFYLHGDTIPDARKDLQLSGIDEVSMPVFETRGILPFHNFPSGPDWWNTDDYLIVISQLSKMGMNFIGLHWYRGIFKRIMKTHPLDYYWLWTYEMWGDFGLTRRQLADVKAELQLVYEVLQEMSAPFKLAICGWRPGTPDPT